jgi:hypothetical protein
MQVVIEELNLPESGAVELKVNRSFEIKVTAEEARRKVNQWLSWEVSMLIVADPPTLHIGEAVVWRVPAWIGFPRVGRAGDVGSVDVDVQTGEMYDLEQAKTQIESCASVIAKRLPPYQPRKVMPSSVEAIEIAPTTTMQSHQTCSTWNGSSSPLTFSVERRWLT